MVARTVISSFFWPRMLLPTSIPSKNRISSSVPLNLSFDRGATLSAPITLVNLEGTRHEPAKPARKAQALQDLQQTGQKGTLGDMNSSRPEKEHKGDIEDIKSIGAPVVQMEVLRGSSKSFPPLCDSNQSLTMVPSRNEQGSEWWLLEVATRN